MTTASDIDCILVAHITARFDEAATCRSDRSRKHMHLRADEAGIILAKLRFLFTEMTTPDPRCSPRTNDWRHCGRCGGTISANELSLLEGLPACPGRAASTSEPRATATHPEPTPEPVAALAGPWGRPLEDVNGRLA